MSRSYNDPASALLVHHFLAAICKELVNNAAVPIFSTGCCAVWGRTNIARGFNNVCFLASQQTQYFHKYNYTYNYTI